MKKHITSIFAALALVIASAFTATAYVQAADADTIAVSAITHAVTDSVAPAVAITASAVETATTLPWQLALIPVLTPLIIMLVKMVMPKIPSALIPILAPVLGCAFDLILHFSAGTNLNIWLAMGLGLGGVGIREILDQLKQTALAK